MNMFNHPALRHTENRPLVYTAMSKHTFYYRMFVSKFVLEQGAVPLNPFMLFDYFLLDTVDRDLVRASNNTIVRRCDEVWVFGPVSNGVLAEIRIAKECGKLVKYFAINKPYAIVPIQREQVELEDEMKQFSGEL